MHLKYFILSGHLLHVSLKKKTEPNDKGCRFYKKGISHDFNTKIHWLKSGSCFCMNNCTSQYYFIITNESMLYFKHVFEVFFFY